MLVKNSTIAKVNELKSIKFTIKTFQKQIFLIYNLKSKWQNHINLKINVKTKTGKIFLTLVSKTNHPKKYQVKIFFISKFL